MKETLNYTKRENLLEKQFIFLDFKNNKIDSTIKKKYLYKNYESDVEQSAVEQSDVKKSEVEQYNVKPPEVKPADVQSDKNNSKINQKEIAKLVKIISSSNNQQSIKKIPKNMFEKELNDFEVFTNDESTFQDKRNILSQLFNEVIEELINILESNLNNASSLQNKKDHFLFFIWKLKKLLIITNSLNLMKVKNNI